jgi:nitrogen fixation protein FixH
MSATTSQRVETEPKFNPWPYGITAFLVLFFGCVVSFGIFAVRQRVDLVRVDYYEEELRYGKQYDRLSRTKSLEHSLSVAHLPEAHQIAVQLPPEHAVNGAKGTIQFYRPSDARLDREMPLATTASGMQLLDASTLQAGLWRVRVTWQSGGHEYFHASNVVIPASGATGTKALTL